MSKSTKIILNIVVFLLIAGFGYYMIRSMSSDKRTTRLGEERTESAFVSPYKLIKSFEMDTDIVNFDVFENSVFVALSDKISVFDLSGNFQHDFPISPGIRDIAVAQHLIYLTYSTKIEIYSFTGKRMGGWESCSPNSDYCALAITENYVFVTDVSERHVVKYNKEGRMLRFIRSPDRFILPDRNAFDIIAINDTIYVANSGRHRIESYTLCGEFITSFGKAGSQPGAFAGCCNPVFLAATPAGNILTSEKGNPRISSYGRDGKFRMVLFDSQALGGGRNAYRMRVSGEHIYVASRRTVSVFTFDTMRLEKACNKSCDGCKKACSK